MEQGVIRRIKRLNSISVVLDRDLIRLDQHQTGFIDLYHLVGPNFIDQERVIRRRNLDVVVGKSVELTVPDFFFEEDGTGLSDELLIEMPLLLLGEDVQHF